MTKKEILRAIGFKGTDQDIWKSVVRVQDLLTAVPEDADFGAMTGVDKFVSLGAYGLFDVPDSRLTSEENKKETKSRILSNLESITTEITSWIQNHPLEVKYNIVSINDKKDRARRKWLIVVLVLVAAVAIALTIIQSTTSLIAKDIPIGEIIGLVDLVIGIGGFVYELSDDNKKEKVCNAIQEISESKTDQELSTSIEKYRKAQKKNVMLSLFQIGPVQQIEEQTINNYYGGGEGQQTVRRHKRGE